MYRHYAVSTGFGSDWSSIKCVCGWSTKTHFTDTAKRRFRKHLIATNAANLEAVEAAKSDPAFVEFPQ